jgi:hypothetical protein
VLVVEQVLLAEAEAALAVQEAEVVLLVVLDQQTQVVVEQVVIKTLELLVVLEALAL